MQTHYVRRERRTHYNNKLASPVESVIFHNTPTDKLMVADDLYAVIKDRCKTEQVPVPPRKGFDNLLSSLAEREFLHEVPGVRLDRLVGNI